MQGKNKAVHVCGKMTGRNFPLLLASVADKGKINLEEYFGEYRGLSVWLCHSDGTEYDEKDGEEYGNEKTLRLYGRGVDFSCTVAPGCSDLECWDAFRAFIKKDVLRG